MEKIKFRVWCNDPQKYYEHSFAVINGKPFYEADPVNKDYVHVNIKGNLESFYSDWAKFLPLKDCVLEQFTGLLDKNGVEIYEGDILKTETDKLMFVGWSKKFASFILNREGWAFSHWFGESCNPENCEVVGNIHQNSELLNK